MGLIEENIKRVSSIFGKNLFGKEVLIPAKSQENLPLEKEDIEVIEVDETGNVVAGAFQHGYTPEERLETIRAAISKYRSMSKYGEIESAIQEITDEAIVKDDDGEIIDLDLGKIDDEVLDEELKDKIHDEFSKILELLKWNQRAEKYFKQWYIDGRAYFQVFADPEKPKKGIRKIRFLNPNFLTKVMIKNKETNRIEYFYYYKPEEDAQNMGFYFGREDLEPALIPADHVIFVSSGFVDYDNSMYISYLHKAIKPFNNLKDVEDSAIIYRLTRAPERRVFYTDVSKLPPTKAEAYMNNLMRKFANKLVYNSTTGEMDQRKNTISMIEDYYFPVNADGRGSKVETLQGGQQLGEIEDIKYFKRKLLEALKVPYSRFDQGERSFFNPSQTAEIDREELRFSKFINKLRDQFGYELFAELLKRQLVLKNILNKREFRKIEQDILFEWSKDMHYEAVKFREELKAKMEILGLADPYVGKYIQRKWIFEKIFDLTDEEIRDWEDGLAYEAETGQVMIPGEEGEAGEFGATGGDFGGAGETLPGGFEDLGGEGAAEDEFGNTPEGEIPGAGGAGETPEALPEPETDPGEIGIEAGMSRKPRRKKKKASKPKKKDDVLLFGALIESSRRRDK